MIYFWISVIVILTIIEATTVNLTTIWFVGGGIVALITSLFTNNFLIQFGIFVVVGVVLLVTTRPAAIRLTNKDKVATNADRVINMLGIVTEEINPNETGEVKVDGKRWTAYSQHRIHTGRTIKVVSIDGVKLEVEEV
ncbi:MAG: NfeD family protein [Anaerovoracaceae bacterium]|jgi:membrane protein implicated in regulation of membrane protease activity